MAKDPGSQAAQIAKDRLKQAPAAAKVDIVIPLYNEEEALPALHAKLQQINASEDCQYRIIYVDDGSSDRTPDVLRELVSKDAKTVVIELSRNFGHQAALTAGLDQAEGDYVITLDGDGQHPPELIPEMVRLAQAGYDIVLAQRIKGESPRLKEFTSNFFYRFITLIGDTNMRAGISDFRLINRPVLLALRELREYHRLLRGMVNWMGYRTVILPYHQPERLAGKSKYTVKKMVRLAVHAIFSFSLVPLYLGISVGVIFLILALAEMAYVLSFWISGRQGGLAPGWSSLMFVLLVVGGSLMIIIGFIGIYVGFIFQEVKRRPIYLIREKWTKDNSAIAGKSDLIKNE